MVETVPPHLDAVVSHIGNNELIGATHLVAEHKEGEHFQCGHGHQQQADHKAGYPEHDPHTVSCVAAPVKESGAADRELGL